MRKSVLVVACLTVGVVSAGTAEARRLPDPVPLPMKDARTVTLLQAADLSEAMNDGSSPVAHSSGIGRCERLTDSRVRCRLVARGTYEECRAWSYTRSTDDPDTIIGWLRDLRCKPISE